MSAQTIELEYLACTVGGHPWWSNRQDAYVARLKKGDGIFWKEKGFLNGKGDTEWRFAFVRMIGNYDGFFIHIDGATGRTIFSDMIEVRIPEDWPPPELKIETRLQMKTSRVGK